MDREKTKFLAELKELGPTLTAYVSTNGAQWAIKGFVDVDQNVYTLSFDTKLISKILEIQLFPKLLDFADSIGYAIVLAEKQNWYPDLSFVKKSDRSIKFALDIKTTSRLDGYDGFCNGFTLGSHGEYFRERTSTKNVQFPYGAYKAPIALGILYTRACSADVDATKVRRITELTSITSVIGNLSFFVEEKWKIASDRGGGNTANIGSINYIPDLLSGNGVFANLGEDLFDEYWINQGVLQVPDPKQPGKFKKLTKLTEFPEFKGMNTALVNTCKPMRKTRTS
ncbi:MAG: type II restriction endonuclease [Hyphomicrobiales bacterium]